MLAELIDAVVGVDTHRDTHQVEIAYPTGAPIATTAISNDSTGYAELLAWIFDHTPGPRLAVSIEGTRSYGVGLARAVAAAGLLVIECEQPNRKARRGRGKSDPIDAHLAVLTSLRCDTERTLRLFLCLLGTGRRPPDLARRQVPARPPARTGSGPPPHPRPRGRWSPPRLPHR
jgi:hypothetical protein